MIVNVSNPADERIQPYVGFRERDCVRNKRVFIAEGKTVLQVLVDQSRFKIASLLILENRLAGLQAVVEKADPATPIYVVDKATMNTIAGFEMHRGVLALVHAADDAPQLMEQMPSWKRLVVLSGLNNHDNVGAIFRNCAAFGVDGALIDSATCDPLYRKAIRVSVGGVLKVPYLTLPDMTAIISLLARHGIEPIALSPRGKTALHNWKPPQKAALVLGTEGDGLEQHWLEELQSVRIDMAPGFDSLNVATSGAIALHHIFNPS